MKIEAQGLEVWGMALGLPLLAVIFVSWGAYFTHCLWTNDNPAEIKTKVVVTPQVHEVKMPVSVEFSDTAMSVTPIVGEGKLHLWTEVENPKEAVTLKTAIDDSVEVDPVQETPVTGKVQSTIVTCARCGIKYLFGVEHSCHGAVLPPPKDIQEKWRMEEK